MRLPVRRLRSLCRLTAVYARVTIGESVAYHGWRGLIVLAKRGFWLRKPTQLVVMTSQRTGSTLLCEFSRQLPDVGSNYEVLNSGFFPPVRRLRAREHRQVPRAASRARSRRGTW